MNIPNHDAAAAHATVLLHWNILQVYRVRHSCKLNKEGGMWLKRGCLTKRFYQLPSIRQKSSTGLNNQLTTSTPLRSILFL